MTSTFVRRTLASGAALAAVLALAACESSGGVEDPQGGGSEETTSASPSEPTETSEEPSVAPATGLRLETGGVAVHAPEGWEKYVPPVVFSWRKHAAEPETVDTTLLLSVHTSLNPGRTPEERAQSMLKQQAELPGSAMKRAGTVTLDGVEFFQNIGRQSRDVWLYQYGAAIGNNDAQISVFFDKWAHPDRADRDAIVAAILASVEVDDSAG
jgi:hypothetical protein